MTLLVGHLLSKLLCQSLLVSVLLIVHQLGIHPLFAVRCHHLLMIKMMKTIIHENLLAIFGARVAICLIEIIQTETGAVTGAVIERGTETGIEKGTGAGMGSEKGTEIGDMIMKGGLERAIEGIMIRSAVMVAGITQKVLLVEAGAGAEAEVEASKLIVIQVRKEMESKKRLLHLAIWPSLEICTVT